MGLSGARGLDGGDMDPTNTSLYLGGITAATTSADVSAALEQYGRIVRVALVPKNRCAFVDFADRAAAEAAYVGCGGTVVLGESKVVCSVNWSKSKKKGHGRDQDDGAGGTAAAMAVPPPPGIAPKTNSKQQPGIPASAMYYPSASGKHDGSAPVKR